MRTIEAEVEQILAGLDEQFRLSFCGTKIADMGLADLAFKQLLEQVSGGGSLEETMSGIFVGLAKMPIPQQYLKHFLKACAHSVSAVLFHRHGNEIEAWQQVVDSKAEAGAALAYFISDAELRQKQTETSNRNKTAADVLHDRPGGSRDKQAAMRAAWASGKYTSRDLCAEQECAGLNMAPGTARKALRNTPEPPRRCTA